MEKPVNPAFVDGEKVSSAIDEAIAFLGQAYSELEGLETGKEGGLKACSAFFREQRSELLGTMLSFAYMKEIIDNIGKGLDSIECIDIEVLTHLILIDLGQVSLIRPLVASRSKTGVMDGALNPASISLINEKFKSNGCE